MARSISTEVVEAYERHRCGYSDPGERLLPTFPPSYVCDLRGLPSNSPTWNQGSLHPPAIPIPLKGLRHEPLVERKGLGNAQFPAPSCQIGDEWVCMFALGLHPYT